MIFIKGCLILNNYRELVDYENLFKMKQTIMITYRMNFTMN